MFKIDTPRTPLIHFFKFSFFFLLMGCTTVLPLRLEPIYYSAMARGSAPDATLPGETCAGYRMWRDALSGGEVLIADQGFIRASTDEEEREFVAFYEGRFEKTGEDCSATLAASPQQFSNFLDSRTRYRVPPMYPRAQNPTKARTRIGDIVPQNEYLNSPAPPVVNTANNSNSDDALREAELLMNAGSLLMGGGGTSPHSGRTCYLQSDRISGFNKLCEYFCPSGDTVRTIPATQICSLTIRN